MENVGNNDSAVDSTENTPINNEVSNQEANSNEQVDNQSVNQSDKVVQRKLSKQMKLKIDGEEFIENLPFEYDENDKTQVEYLKRQLQMAKVANKRMNEASTTRKQAEQFIQLLQQDPMKVLSNEKIMGQKKFREIAEQFILQQIEEESMSPEERKHKDMEQRLRQYEEQEKQIKAKEEADQAQKLEEHYAQQFQKVIIEGLNESGLPKNPFTVKRMAELMQKNLQHGLELEPKHLAQLVKEDYQRELASIIGGANADQLLSLFGEETANKIRKHDLEKLKSGNLQPKNNQQEIKRDNPPKTMTMSEWREQQEKKKF